jgi:hypothetical protein
VLFSYPRFIILTRKDDINPYVKALKKTGFHKE